MWGLESRSGSRTSRSGSRSRLFWQSLSLVSKFEPGLGLGLGGYGLDYITGCFTSTSVADSENQIKIGHRNLESQRNDNIPRSAGETSLKQEKLKKRSQSTKCYIHFHNIHWGQGRMEGWLGLNPTLSFLFCKKLFNFAWEIICFRILFACYFVNLMEIPRNKFACSFQGNLWMSQRVIIMVWWESGLSSASRTISPLFADISSTTLV